MRTGRKPKPGKRYPCGKRTIGQRQEDIVSTAVEGRMRTMGISRELAKDPNMGSPLGRLLHYRYITAEQADAGYNFALTMRDYLAGTPAQRPTQGKAGFIPGAGGNDDGEQPPEAVAKTRALERKARTLMAALTEVDRTDPFSESATSIVWAVCVDEKDRTGEQAIGSLRVGLNAIHRILYGRGQKAA
jgi:hypothetical protein